MIPCLCQLPFFQWALSPSNIISLMLSIAREPSGKRKEFELLFSPLTYGTEQFSPFCFWGLLVMSATAKSPRKLCERSLSAMREKCAKNCRTWERYGFLCRESAYRRNLSCCSCLRIIDSPSRSLVCWNHIPLSPFPLPAFPPWVTNAANPDTSSVVPLTLRLVSYVLLPVNIPWC